MMRKKSIQKSIHRKRIFAMAMAGFLFFAMIMNSGIFAFTTVAAPEGENLVDAVNMQESEVAEEDCLSDEADLAEIMERNEELDKDDRSALAERMVFLEESEEGEVEEGEVEEGEAESEFVFLIPNPAPVRYGETFQNTASGGKATGGVSYAIADGEEYASIDSASGLLTPLKGNGSVTVEATNAAAEESDEEEEKAYYTIDILKACQEPISFQESNPADITYEENGTYTNCLLGDETFTAVYSIKQDAENTSPDAAGINAETGELTLLRAGTVTVEAYRQGNDQYDDSDRVSYTIHILRAEQPQAGFEDADPGDIDYVKDGTYTNRISGDESFTAVYSIKRDAEGTDPDAASINAETGELTLLRAGTVTIEAYRQGNDRYHDSNTASFTLTIRKSDQSPIYFQDEAPETTYAPGADFSGPALMGGEMSCDAKYNIKSGDAAVMKDPSTGELTLLKGGIVVVEAVREENDCYNRSNAAFYTLTVRKASQSDISFLNENPVVTYSPNAEVPSPGITGGESGCAAVYRIKSGDAADIDPSTGVLTLLKSGTVTVEAYQQGNDMYQDSNTASFTLTILRANQNQFMFEYQNPVVVYQTGLKYSNSVIGKEAEGDIVYEITSGEDVAVISGNELTILKPGTVTVKAANGGDNNYHPVFATYTLTVVKGEQLYFQFAKEQASITYSDGGTYQNPVIQGEGTGKVTYEITAGDAAVIDSVTGILSVKKAGTVTVKATKEEDDYFQSKEICYQLTIQKAGQTGFGFAVPNPENIYSSAGGTYSNEVRGGEGSNPATYSVIAGNAALVDSQTGIVTVNSPGKITVRAVKAEDDCYLATSATYELTILAPVARIGIAVPDYDNNGICYFRSDQNVTVSVLDIHFDISGISADITAEDIAGDPIALPVDYTEYLWNPANWEQMGQTWLAVLPFDTEGNYTFDIGYGTGGATNCFTIDKTAPQNITVKYSDYYHSVITGGILFQYYNSPVTVTISAEDSISGVMELVYSYQKSADTNSVNAELLNQKISEAEISYSDSGRKASATFTVPRYALGVLNQFKGNIIVQAKDKSQNNVFYTDNQNVIVVDNIAPARTISYSAPVKIYDGKTLFEKSSYEENSDSVLFYNKNAVMTFIIREANFYSEDVEIKVSQNGGAFIPASVNNWMKNDNEWSGTLILSEEGEYVVTVAYTDRSGNKMTPFQSEKIVVDKTNPTIQIEYGNKNVIREWNGIKYYDAVQTARITITDRYFKPENVVSEITAKDVTGAPVSGFDNPLNGGGIWVRNGDVHVATIAFSQDANYSIGIAIKDMAENSAAYPKELFTVDTSAPQNLTFSYSKSMMDSILEHITFGYYNAPVTVTVTAEDHTSGIYGFSYSCIKQENVSSVNMEALDQIIAAADIAYSEGEKKAAVSFQVPGSALSSSGQFRGVVEFKAIDRADNEITQRDTREIVVDSISPQAAVTYNTPLASSNGISYYAGDITATVRIMEANFYPSDVAMSISRDGAAYHQIQADWKQNGDEWTNTVQLSEDGDYIIRISYQDRSDNKMADYVSEQLTIDTQKPSVIVKGIKHESANKNETIGFTITASDINFNPSGFEPVLVAVVKGEDEVFRTQTFSLGDRKTITDGREYAYIVENLDIDAVYSLTCRVTDMAGNTTEEMVVADSGNESLNEVDFSVNRNGSTFTLDKHTLEIVRSYYIRQVDEDVVIVETNVDPLKQYYVELNHDILEEGTDYWVERPEGEGRWNQYIYRIRASLFEKEADYNIVIVSTDKAETTVYSDIKSTEVSFVVDRTAPTLTASGIEDNGRYQVESQTVNVILRDDGGRLDKAEVIIMDTDGRIIDTPISLSGEELLMTLEAESGKLAFEVANGLYQNVRVICMDAAGNELKRDYNNITVSSNAYVIFWADKKLRYGAAGGLLTAAGGISAAVFLRKRRFTGKRSNKKVKR